MKGKLIWTVFWVMVAVVIIMVIMVVSTIFIGVPPYVILSGIGVLFGLGVALLVLTVKKKVTGKLRLFWLLTGASAVGMPVFVGLHNLVSGLFNMEEAVFFTLATIACPLAFLVGAIGTIVLAVKNKPPEYSGQNAGGG